MKLHSKTTFVYLFFTLLVLLASAWVLLRIFEQKVETSVNSRFTHSLKRLSRHIAHNELPPKASPYLQIKVLKEADTSEFIVSQKDTTIYIPETGESKLFRQQTVRKNIEGTCYEITMLKSLREYYEARSIVLKYITIIFLSLTVLLVIFNSTMSGYLWKPFYRILNAMKSYSLTKEKKKILIHTSSKEFRELNSYFQDMTAKIEEDFSNLKEYTENMAHEIQTPLSVIRNKIERLLGNETMMQSDPETISSIYDEINHLSNLSNSLNLLTKIENAEFTNKQKIYTWDIIEKHANAVDEFAKLKDITIQLSLSEDHYVEMDPVLLDVLVKNLLKNAIRYSPAHNDIHITTKEDEWVFQNAGEPLQGDPERIFKRFYKDGKTEKSLGLGLSIVQKICDINGLKISYHYHNGLHTFHVTKG